jgi:hypothetical protein
MGPLGDIRKPFSKWFSNLAAADEPDSPKPSFSAKEIATLSCQCHPDLEPDRPHYLCNGCRKFTEKCHWIQLHKLPPAEFSKLSDRKLKKGAYVSDGDASGGFAWDYKHVLQDSSFGCHLCELMKASMESSISKLENNDLTRARPVSLTVYYVPSKEGLACLQVSTTNSGEQNGYGSLWLLRKFRSGGLITPENQWNLQSLASSNQNPFDEKLSAPMGKCTGSHANFELARQWIKNCRETHVKCNKGGSVTAIYPSRLVHVGTESADPHLHEVDPNKPTPEYLTLSHCWGGQSPLTLRSASLADFKNRISFSALSRTFQEAMIAVRNLGYSYVWIDSLCIIQDSTEDWEHEAQIMGDIYRNSVLTIAATASKNGDEGCFRLRNTLWERPCLLWEDDQRGIFVDIGEDDVVKRYRGEVNNGSLNTRAWVLQERVLSSRVIHYAATSVYWDCQEAHLSDSGRKLSDNREISALGGSKDEDLRLFGDVDWSVEEYFSERWRFNVERYCDMKLTVESDRFVAFTGIIKYVEDATGLHCISGLWKEHLVAHILWRVEDSSTAYRMATRQQPSWSWASVAGPIRYFPPKESGSMTFWYPENEHGWPKMVLDRTDPNPMDKLVSEMVEQFDKVDPKNGYSAQEVYCSKYIPENSTDDTICISGKLNRAYGPAIIVRDVFTDMQKDMIVNILHIPKGTSAHRLLVCVWPDVASQQLSKDFLYLRISARGAKSQLIAGFLRDPGIIDAQNPDTNYLAPYAVHTSGLVLEPSLLTDQYRRVGFFRAIETFATAPPPHPKGIDVEALFFRNSWFGDECVNKAVKLL